MSTRRTPYAHTLETPAGAPPETIVDDKADEIEILIEDDPQGQVSDPAKEERTEAAPAPAIEVEPEPKPEPAKLSADDEAFTRLKAQLDREKQAREAAQNRAAQLETDHLSTRERLRQEQERAQAVQIQHLEAQEVAIDNAISFAESQAAQAQREIARGLSEGDYEASTTAYRALAKAESDLSRLKDGKVAIEAQKKAPVQRYDPQPTPQQQPKSPYERIEAYITQPAHSPRAQQYMRDHYDHLFKDFDNGAQQLHKLLGAHYLAKGDGIVENSDAYYNYLDRQMGFKQDPAPVAPEPVVAPPPAKKAIPPSAPVSRGESNSSGNGTSIRLTKAEVEFCTASGIKPTDYARNKLAAMKGATDPNYSGPRFTNDR